MSYKKKLRILLVSGSLYFVAVILMSLSIVDKYVATLFAI